MGYFDGLVDGSFKKADGGTTLFYPNGIFGKGYVIPNVRKKEEIRSFLKRYTIAALATIVISAAAIFSSVEVFAIPWWIPAVLYLSILMALSLLADANIRYLTKGLALADQRISPAEMYRNSARSHDLGTLWVLAVLSFFMTIGSGWMALDGDAAWYLRLAGLLGVLFFGAGATAIGYMIKVKGEK